MNLRLQILAVSIVGLTAGSGSAQAIPEPVESTTVFFKRTSTSLNSAGTRSLRALMHRLQPEEHVEVIALAAHGERGSARLARERAERVAEFLVGEGIAQSRVVLRSVSPSLKGPLRSDAVERAPGPGVEVLVVRTLVNEY